MATSEVGVGVDGDCVFTTVTGRWVETCTTTVECQGTLVPGRGDWLRATTHFPLVLPGPTVVNGSNFKVGVATWYNYVPGRCATWYLPKGTRITVLDLGSGRSITCVITDRENHSGNHVVDLNESQFAQLEPLAKGVISVKVSW